MLEKSVEAAEGLAGRAGQERRCHRRLIADATVLLCRASVWHLGHDGRRVGQAQDPPVTPAVEAVHLVVRSPA